jgi:type IV secretory pathway TraG/TraD family ATPase VirD4
MGSASAWVEGHDLMSDSPRGMTPLGVLFALLIVVGAAIALLEKALRYPSLAHALGPYLGLRNHVLEHWVVSLAIALLVLVTIGAVFLGLKKLSAGLNRWRDRVAGLAFTKESYELPPRDYSLGALVRENPAGTDQVVLGLSDEGKPVYLTDHARSMHVHVLEQTGSGKTRSVIEPLAFQDLWRGRGVLVLDGKGSEENEERLASMAAAAGRLSAVKNFTLNPFRRSHTYNPLHLVPDADPQAVRLPGFCGQSVNDFWTSRNR